MGEDVCERRHSDCDQKITALAQKVERDREDIKTLFQLHEAKDDKFDRHVEKEEGLWREMREDLTSGMEAIRQELHELVKGALNSRLDLERSIAEKYVSKEAARLAWGVASIVGGGVIILAVWFFTNYGAQKVSHQHAAEMQAIVKTIVDEINKHEIMNK